ncbi:uncharacterized protein LOC118213075 [Tachysurus ichikawai]
MWRWVQAVVLPMMIMMQGCPDLQPAPPSGVMTRPYPRVLINNLQWIHVPVLANLTAWSPDLDERCRGESVTKMYKDLLTTDFLRYHGTVATSYSTEPMLKGHPKEYMEGSSYRRKLLGFVDSMLGATGTGLGISNWISAQELRQNELKLKALIGQQILQTDAYLQEGLSEERETVQDVHTIASALSIIAQHTKKAFNTMQKQLYCSQFASIKHQEITQILNEVLAGKVPPTLFTEEVFMKWFGLKDCFNSTSDNLKTFMDKLGKCKLPIPYSYIIQMARISSHPIPAGFYSPLDYGPLMEGIHLPFTRRGGEP